MKAIIELVVDIIANNQAQMSIALMMKKSDMEIVVNIPMMIAARRELDLFGYPPCLIRALISIPPYHTTRNK